VQVEVHVVVGHSRSRSSGASFAASAREGRLSCACSEFWARIVTRSDHFHEPGTQSTNSIVFFLPVCGTRAPRPQGGEQAAMAGQNAKVAFAPRNLETSSTLSSTEGKRSDGGQSAAAEQLGSVYGHLVVRRRMTLCGTSRALSLGSDHV